MRGARAGAKKGKKKGGRERVQEQESEQLGEEDDMNLMDQANMGIDQLQLTQEEKDETIIKTLSANNPQAPHNICQFSFKDRHFKVEDQVDMLTFHYSVAGNIMLAQSEEADDQATYWEDKAAMEKKLLENVNSEVKQNDIEDPTEKDEFTKKKSLRNQFNLQERSSQTFNLPLREKGIKTDPPVMSNYSEWTTQWMIFDAYMQQFEDIQRQEMEEQMKNKKDKKPQQIQQQHVEDPLYSTSMKRCLKIMERMIVQNADEEKFEDYKYYEDNTMDRESGNFGSVLPLWRFSTEKSRKKHVTAIQWNPKYKDLFAVGYGSYDFLKQSTGLICCYTIKNPIWPEYQFQTESGVMCLDFHPQNPALLAVGLYDGTVMVFDIRLKGNNKPIYMSTVRTAKHTDPVWQVKWNEDITVKDLNFYSISSDGRVTNWHLMKNKLEAEEVCKLKLVVDEDKGFGENKKETFLYGLAGGMCFDFNTFKDHIFLVGTEEGKIHLCSKAYSGQYLQSYDGHYLAVYSVKWNKYHERIFMSCSADWTVKMWDMDITRPIWQQDLKFAVGDIQWAPYSATVFSAVTSEGKLFVWDLNQDKHSYLSDHLAMKKARGLHVAFNKEDPIILVGDERGGVNSFKLSHSLYQGPEHYVPTKEERDNEKEGEDPGYPTPEDMEKRKMEKFLDSLDKHVY